MYTFFFWGISAFFPLQEFYVLPHKTLDTFHEEPSPTCYILVMNSDWATIFLLKLGEKFKQNEMHYFSGKLAEGPKVYQLTWIVWRVGCRKIDHFFGFAWCWWLLVAMFVGPAEVAASAVSLIKFCSNSLSITQFSTLLQEVILSK